MSDNTLEQLVRQYADDLRRNSSGSDDYPWDFARGVADNLLTLVERSRSPASDDARLRVQVERATTTLKHIVDCAVGCGVKDGDLSYHMGRSAMWALKMMEQGE